jgi:acyl-CoA thioesterase
MMLFDRLPNRNEVESLMGTDAYAEHAGMEVLRAEPGYAEVRLTLSPSVLNGHGNLHGGALFTLADYAGAIASNMHGEATAAITGSISFLSAVRGGHVVARARTVKAGRRITFQNVDIYDDRGVLAATFQGTAARVRRKDSLDAAGNHPHT